MLAFAHTLYRDVLYESIPFTRRADLHRRVGNILERAWGEDAVQIAAELSAPVRVSQFSFRATRPLFDLSRFTVNGRRSADSSAELWVAGTGNAVHMEATASWTAS